MHKLADERQTEGSERYNKWKYHLGEENQRGENGTL